jgi:hypothetical protein
MSMIFSNLASPAEALTGTKNRSPGFAQAGNRGPFFEIILSGKQRRLGQIATSGAALFSRLANQGMLWPEALAGYAI